MLITRSANAENGTPQSSANPVRELTLEQLGNVEVTTTSKEPEQLWKTSAAVYVLTSEDIRRSGATSIPEALRLVPGVEVARIDSNQWAVGIRGSETNFSKGVLVLIDGRSVYTPLYAGVYWDVQDLVLDDIDRIEVVRGPGATVWGPNSADGVINIITKKTADTQGALVSVLSGNVDHLIAEAQYGGNAGGHVNYRVYGKGFALGHEFEANQDHFDEWHQQRGGFRMDWDPSDRSSYMLEGDIYGGTSPAETGPATFDASVSGGDIVARWQHTFENGSDIYLQTYFDRTVRIDALAGETRDTFDIDFLHRFKVADRHRISWGFGLHWSPNRFIAPTPVLNVVPEVETDHIHTGFLQDEIHFLNDKVILTAGAKLQHNNFSGFDVQPTVRALWNPNRHQSFWTAVTRAVTTPSRIEEGMRLFGGQLSVNPPLFLLVSGNPSFQSETLLGYEGGYRQLLSRNVYLDLDVFHNDYNHLQSFSPPTLVGNDLTIFYENAIAGSTNGIEIGPSWKPTLWWNLSGSYSFVGINFHANAPGSDISSTGSVRTYEGSSPGHQIKIQSDIDIGKKFEFDQDYFYVSALPAQKVSAYQTMDGRFEWKIRKELNLSLVGQNLFQPYHFEWGTGDPTEALIGIRRSAYLKFTWANRGAK
ncbi:MAG TPA: TonB-dependent receptor [Terriglobales bacterium]|nr:TonB-dependent receptor [Terriglobales bacterium]